MNLTRILQGSRTDCFSYPGRGGGTLQSFWWGCAARTLKPQNSIPHFRPLNCSNISLQLTRICFHLRKYLRKGNHLPMLMRKKKFLINKRPNATPEWNTYPFSDYIPHIREHPPSPPALHITFHIFPPITCGFLDRLTVSDNFECLSWLELENIANVTKQSC